METGYEKDLTFEEKLYPPEIAMSPSFALARFESMIKKYGSKEVLETRKFQSAREMWVSSTFLLGMSTITSEEYWVAPEFRDATPDTYGFSVIPHPTYSGGKRRERINIEVWVANSNLCLKISHSVGLLRRPRCPTLVA